MPGVEYEATQPPPQSQALGVIHENSQRMLDGLRQGQHTPPGPSMAELKAKLAALQKELDRLEDEFKALTLNKVLPKED
jgi:predicted mannosyl-3-phosphoglycerate phosphatase (HAD superfamily)